MNFDTTQAGLVGGVLSIPLPREQLNNAHRLMQSIQDGKIISVEIKLKQKKRSTNANAYLWKLLTAIATELGSSKNEIYKHLLIKYGTKFKYMVTRKESISELEEAFKGAVEIVGEVMVEGENGRSKALQVLCYLGTSTYTSKQFAAFLDRVIEEAEDLGIECISKAERELMMADWGDKDESLL